MTRLRHSPLKMHEREAVERGIRSARSIYDWSEQIAEELKVDLWQVEVGTYTDALDSRLDLSAAQFDKIKLDDHTEAGEEECAE